MGWGIYIEVGDTTVDIGEVFRADTKAKGHLVVIGCQATQDSSTGQPQNADIAELTEDIVRLAALVLLCVALDRVCAALDRVLLVCVALDRVCAALDRILLLALDRVLLLDGVLLLCAALKLCVLLLCALDGVLFSLCPSSLCPDLQSEAAESRTSSTR